MTQYPINIALVDGQLDYGGAERQLYEIATKLDKTKFRPIVFCLSKNDYPFGQKLRKEGIKVYVIERGFHFNPMRAIRLANLFKEERVNIVHSFLHTAAFYSSLACMISPANYHISSVRSLETGRPGPLRFFDKWALKRSDIVTANSKAAAEFARKKFSVADDKIVMVYNGINIDTFSPSETTIRTELGIGGHDKVITIISKDSQAKNISAFFELADHVSAVASNTYFLLVGRGLGKEGTTQYVNISNSKRIIPLGERFDIPNILNGSDIFVLTSRSESLPNAVMEAMAVAKPVIATKVGGVPELVVDGETGLLVESGDTENLVKSTMKLLKNEDLRRDMGKKGRGRIKNMFSLDRMIDDLHRLYLDVLSRPQRA
ncbi:glycosyltransferase [Candidatus Omnitrophota bacterium]